MEKKVGAVYAAEVRSLFKAKYITPAVNTRMNNQYEKDRVNLLILMDKQVKEKKYEEAKKNLASLKVMEDKSKKLKADSKRYPTYKTYEASLNTWKQKLVKQIEAALAPPEPAPEAEKEPKAEPEVPNEPADEPPAAETAEPNQSEENPAAEAPAEPDTNITQ